MNKFIIYGLLLLAYLTLSKGFSPNEFGVKYVKSNDDLIQLIPGSPVSLILTDIHSTGFLIKTYYHKYKIVYGFQSYEELIVRTSRKFTEQNTHFLGMSTFRRYKEGKKQDFTPMPPGSVFIGNKSFGNWVRKGKNSKRWKFFRVYRQIPQYLGWKDYTPTLKTYTQIQEYQERGKPFHGSNDEFGLDGSITKVSFPSYFERMKPHKINFKSFFKNYLNYNFIK